jgi:hypothetical protein
LDVGHRIGNFPALGRRLVPYVSHDINTAVVTGTAISGALLAALRVWGEAGGDDIDELRDYTSRALGLLLELPGLK